MLSREEDIDAHALARQGWTISAIARHLGRDRKTIRAYLRGDRVAGVRKPAGEDAFEPFVDYVRARLSEDPHVQARVLEAQWLGQRDGRDLVAVTFAQRVAGTEAEPRAVVLALVETRDGWRVMDVLGHAEVGEVSVPVGPLAG